MTDTVPSVLAEMWEVGLHEERFGDLIHDWADRLAAARAAEVAAYRRQVAELIDKYEGTPCAEIRWAQERDALLARAEAAERDARELRVDIAKAYAMIPSLPVAPETCDAATDALHYIGLMMGLHDIDPAIATTEDAP